MTDFIYSAARVKDPIWITGRSARGRLPHTIPDDVAQKYGPAAPPAGPLACAYPLAWHIFKLTVHP